MAIATCAEVTNPDSPVSQAYKNAADKGVEAMQAWMKEQCITKDMLPESPWKLPKDCPLWNLNLSLYQARIQLAKVRA